MTIIGWKSLFIIVKIIVIVIHGEKQQNRTALDIQSKTGNVFTFTVGRRFGGFFVYQFLSQQ